MLRGCQVIPLSLDYKGARDYLHGTDICNAVFDAVEEHCKIRNYSGEMSFHRFARTQCDMFLVETQRGEYGQVPSQRVCEGRFWEEGSEWTVWLMETRRPVEDRRAFDEDRIVAAADVVGDAICQKMQLPFSPIEVCVALTKHLHNTNFPLAQQRWIFSKIEFMRKFTAADKRALQVRVLTNLHNKNH